MPVKFFSDIEVEEYNLDIPDDEQLEKMLNEIMTTNEIRCNANSAFQAAPNDLFCACTRLSTPDATLDCERACI
jgi:hypothetical protein